MTTESDLRMRIAAEVPSGLLDHIDRTVVLAERFAARHGLDIPLARLMAVAHDVARAVPPDELLARAEALGIAIDPVERAEPVLLHGQVGALALRERFAVTDERVLHAVWWHTTGHPDYTPEAWSMFVADKVDPHKVERWPALRAVVDLAERSLEAAALAYLELRLAQDAVPHPAALVTRDALRMRVGRP